MKTHLSHSLLEILHVDLSGVYMMHMYMSDTGARVPMYSTLLLVKDKN